jgi:hypothetical protein
MNLEHTPNKVVDLSHEAEHEASPTSITLKNGDPLYYVLLPQAGRELVISATESQQAHDELQQLWGIDPERVKACQGLSPEVALQLLRSIKPH